jgi:flotillin
MVGYYVSEPTEYLAITGMGIDQVVVKKKAMIFPLQKVQKFQIMPMDFSLSLQAMTVEKLNFSLPAVFTIGPEDTDEALTKYAKLLTGDDARNVGKSKGADKVNYVQNIVKGIIEGETRSIVSTMTMEELFRERKVFRDSVIKNVQGELEQFGLKIYNANVKELQDTPGSEYFAYLSRKAHEGALNQARVDVAEARMKGEVGESQRQGQAKQEIAKIHAETAVKETQRKAEKAQADAELTQKEIELEQKLSVSRIVAKRMAEERDAELSKNVELKRAQMELERQRATTVTKAIITRESDQQKADALLYTQTQNAAALKEQQKAETDAAFYRKIRDGEGYKAGNEFKADASLYTAKREAEAKFEQARLAAEAIKMEADAAYYTQKQKAAGMIELANAYGSMANVLGGPQGLLQYMMLENGTYEKLAHANADAIRGLEPKINVWTTGSNADGADSMAPIRNLAQCLPPLFQTIHDQTGMSPPSWLAQLGPQSTSPQFASNGKAVMPAKAPTNGSKN